MSPSESVPMRAVLLSFAVLVLIPCAAWSQGNPLGPEFRVNTYTTNDQLQPSIAADSAGNFVVVWDNVNQFADVFGQRYSTVLPTAAISLDPASDSGPSNSDSITNISTPHFAPGCRISWSFAASPDGVNGFCKKDVWASSAPCCTTALAV